MNERSLSAAAYVIPWLRSSVLHVPATKDTVDPLTVHTDVVEEAYETAELGEADKARTITQQLRAGSANVIDCASPDQ